MPHKIVFVVGMARTGTSIIVKCLEKSGYNIGKKVYGHKYKSQDGVFGYANRKLHVLLKEHMKDQVFDPKKIIRITEPMANEIKQVFNYALTYRVEVLKDPWFHEFFGMYDAVYPQLYEHKFIWTHRDPLESTKSKVRLKYMSNIPENAARSAYKVKSLLKWVGSYNDVHSLYFNKCDSINVYFEDMLNDTKRVGEELSEFLGRPFDTSMISTKETYKEKGTPQ
jgi:hypothetical protein